MTVFIKIIQVILALSVLVIIHELGHFLLARLFKMRVDKFFLFMDIGGFKLFSTKSKWFTRIFPEMKDNETEYGIGWLPLGGYCKINGMVDESLDIESLKNEPQPWEFRTKPAWQRLLVMAGGVLFNFVFAFIMFISILDIWGETYFSNKDNQIYVNRLAFDMGFRSGDRILRFDDYVPENFGRLQADMVRRNVEKATLLRGEDTVELYIDRKRIPEVLNSPDMFGIAVPFIVDTIPQSSVNYGCGLEKGDRIVGIAGNSINFVQDSKELLKGMKDTVLTAQYERAGAISDVQLQVDSTGMMMIFAKSPAFEHREYTFLSAIPAGVKLTFSTIGGYLSDLKMVATPSTGAYKSVGSFVAIAQVFPSAWDWYSFLYILAILSIMLGVMNLIPIPGLDGGHIVFLLYEMVSRKKPSLKFMEATQIVGMMLLFALMILAFGNDIGRLIN